jgi:hypothetical protein
MAATNTKTYYHHKVGNIGSLEEGCYKCGKTRRSNFLAICHTQFIRT